MATGDLHAKSCLWRLVALRVLEAAEEAAQEDQRSHLSHFGSVSFASLFGFGASRRLPSEAAARIDPLRATAPFAGVSRLTHNVVAKPSPSASAAKAT